MAWTTPLGEELPEVWGRLLAGQTGMDRIPHTARLRNSLAAAVRSVPLESSPAARLMGMAYSSARRALDSARQDGSDPGLRLIAGTSLGAYLEEVSERASLSSWATELGQRLGVVSRPIAVSTACSSGADAILLGAELIRAGRAGCCLCGGADVLTLSKRLAHSALGTMSPTMLRAFDVRRDGTLLGEGAAFVVLHAAEDDRDPIAFLRGAGSANDAAGMTAPDPDGLGGRLAVERSLADAALDPEAIGLINAHGSGTPLNEIAERATFSAIFHGACKPLVFATKGNFGHSLGATGAIEAVALIEGLRSGTVPPIVELEQPDPEFQLPLAHRAEHACDARFGLSLTLGFGGFDTSLVFERVQ